MVLATAIVGGTTACAPGAPSPSTSAPATPTAAAIASTPSSADTSATPGPSGSGFGDPGPAMTLGQARTISAARPLRIRSSIVIDLGQAPPTIRMCDAMTRSLPPQCAGDAVRVQGIGVEELSARGPFQRRGNVAWASGVTLVGTLFGDVFTVTE